MSETRSHHFYSCCYLKGFTQSCTRDSKFTVIKFRERKILYNQNLNNFGKQRDFNRIDLEGVPPNELESELSKFEAIADRAIRKVEESRRFEGENRAIILNMMALFAIRNPWWRDHWNNFLNHTNQIMLSFLSSGQVGAKVNGIEVTSELKKSLNVIEGQYKISATRNSHIKRELEGVKFILPYLFNRQWKLVSLADNLNFITSDFPVILLWKDIQQYAIKNPVTPGYGCIDTQIFFPLSKKLALIGDFNGKEENIVGNKKLAAQVNSNVLFFAKEQLYTPYPDFYFFKPNGTMVQFSEKYWKNSK